MRLPIVLRYMAMLMLTPTDVLGAAASSNRATALVAHDPRLDVRVSAAIATAPAPLVSTIRVARDSDNRRLRVSLDGEHYFRSSDIELDGASAPRTHQVFWRDLPAGSYQLVVVLFSATGSRTQQRRDITIVGP